MKEVNYVFGTLEEPDVAALMRIGTQEQLHVSDQLLTEGDHHDAIYLVLDGELSVSVKGRNAVVAYVGKGRSWARCRCSNRNRHRPRCARSPR
jgi:CRP-like cAMP-binding protein